MNDSLKRILSLGVSDLKNPSEKDLKLVFDAYLKDKKIDEDTFRTYMNSVTTSNKAISDALQVFAESHKDIQTKTLNIIEKAIDIMSEELKRGDLNVDERREIRNQVFDLIKQAREESADSRNFLTKFGYIAGSVCIIGMGVGLYIVTKGKNKEVIANGVKMFTKAL